MPALLEKFDQTTNMLRKRSMQLQKILKKDFGIVIMRSYYGLKTDIQKHLDLLGDIGYWDDFGHRTDEDLGNLNIANVTIATRFKIDEKFGGLKMGKSSKQFLLGFFNPVPEFMNE